MDGSGDVACEPSPGPSLIVARSTDNENAEAMQLLFDDGEDDDFDEDAWLDDVGTIVEAAGCASVDRAIAATLRCNFTVPVALFAEAAEYE